MLRHDDLPPLPLWAYSGDIVTADARRRATDGDVFLSFEKDKPRHLKALFKRYVYIIYSPVYIIYNI